MIGRWRWAALLLPLTACSPQRFFYYPNRILYADPERLGIRHEIVSYPSRNGKQLYAVFFPAEGTAKGTVVHFHGNFGNLSNHFPLALFLTKRGFNVLAFDYQGYGASEGSPSPKAMVEDGIASVRYAVTRGTAPLNGVVVFAQSLGGAVGTVVTAEEPLVRGAVLEAAFSSYRSMGAAVARRRVWTWPLLTLVPFLGKTYDPIRHVARISPRPLLFIHGDADEVVPVRMSRELFAAAKEPKSLLIIPGGHHLALRRSEERAAYEDRVAAFFTQALAGEATK